MTHTDCTIVLLIVQDYRKGFGQQAITYVSCLISNSVFRPSSLFSSLPTITCHLSLVICHASLFVRIDTPMNDAFQLLRHTGVEERLAGLFMVLKLLERDEQGAIDSYSTLKRVVDTLTPVFIMQLLYNGHGENRKVMRHGALSFLASAISHPAIAQQFERYSPDMTTILITNATKSEEEALLFVLDVLFNEHAANFTSCLSTMLKDFTVEAPNTAKLATLQSFLLSMPSSITLPPCDSSMLRRIVFDSLHGSAPEEQRDVTLRILASVVQQASIEWLRDKEFCFIRLITSISCNEFRLVHEECLTYLSEASMTLKQQQRWRRCFDMCPIHLRVLQGIIRLLSSEETEEKDSESEEFLTYDVRLFLHKAMNECIEHFFNCVSDASSSCDTCAASLSLDYFGEYRGFVTQALQCFAHFIVHDDSSQLFALRHVTSLLHFSQICAIVNDCSIDFLNELPRISELLIGCHREEATGEDIDVLFALLPCLLPLLLTPGDISDNKSLNEKPIARMMHQKQSENALVREKLLQCPSLAQCAAAIIAAAPETNMLFDANLASSVASCCECLIYYDMICSDRTNRKTLVDIVTPNVSEALSEALTSIDVCDKNAEADCVVQHLFLSLDRVREVFVKRD